MTPEHTLEHILGIYGVKADKYVYLPVPREDLGVLFRELRFTTGAEIGTERGIFAKALLEPNPALHLFCVDAWRSYPGYRDHVNQAKLDRFYAETLLRLAPYEGANVVRGWSMDVVETIPDESLDFVYIDANHDFRHVTDDITEWSKKVRPGGIVAGHDYVKVRSSIDCHVKAVVDAMAYAFKIRPVFIVTGNPFSSWMWVK